MALLNRIASLRWHLWWWLGLLCLLREFVDVQLCQSSLTQTLLVCYQRPQPSAAPPVSWQSDGQLPGTAGDHLHQRTCLYVSNAWACSAPAQTMLLGGWCLHDWWHSLFKSQTAANKETQPQVDSKCGGHKVFHCFSGGWVKGGWVRLERRLLVRMLEFLLLVWPLKSQLEVAGWLEGIDPASSWLGECS